MIRLFIILTLSSSFSYAQWYQIHFSQVYKHQPLQAANNPQRIDTFLTKQILQTKHSLDAALQELDSDSITQALIQAHNQGVLIRVVTETDYAHEDSILQLQKAGISVRTDNDRSGLMHNKFLIFDHKTVWTGSLNTTDNGCYKNNNNAIAIVSEKLAANFSTEFDELWNGQFGKTSPKSIPHPIITMQDGTIITTLFAPEMDVASVLMQQITEAETSVVFMAFSFTHDGIGNTMVARYQDGVGISGIFEKRGSSTKYSEFGKMKQHGINVMTDSNPYVLHHKVIVIDEDTVITGSFNFSNNAAKTNDENLLVIEGNRDIAAAYLGEYRQLGGMMDMADQPVSSEVGKAILVLGGGDKQNNKDWRTFSSVAQYVYKVFQKRQFDAEDDIYYLSPEPT
ncbi:TPA: hypothetical protein EYN65_01590, partial [Candidatus Poribacteria bacterium]|nr:hypothetical protein [Candidatus Poribacteria bacterium]